MQALTSTSCAAGLALALAATPSAAGTAEEIVAFLHAGIEDGAVVNRYRAEREGASPATYRLVSVENAERIEILTVERRSDCSYTLSQREIGRDDRPPLRATLDFSKIDGIDFGTGFGPMTRVWLGAAPGFCTAKEAPHHCLAYTRPSLPLPPSATRDRMLSAMNELQAKFCRPEKS